MLMKCRVAVEPATHPGDSAGSVFSTAQVFPMPVGVFSPAGTTAVQRWVGNRYSAPCELAGQWVTSRLYPTRVEGLPLLSSLHGLLLKLSKDLAYGADLADVVTD
jgi:hypothetical protein